MGDNKCDIAVYGEIEEIRLSTETINRIFSNSNFSGHNSQMVGAVLIVESISKKSVMIDPTNYLSFASEYSSYTRKIGKLYASIGLQVFEKCTFPMLVEQISLQTVPLRIIITDVGTICSDYFGRGVEDEVDKLFPQKLLGEIASTIHGVYTEEDSQQEPDDKKRSIMFSYLINGEGKVHMIVTCVGIVANRGIYDKIKQNLLGRFNELAFRGKISQFGNNQQMLWSVRNGFLHVPMTISFNLTARDIELSVNLMDIPDPMRHSAVGVQSAGISKMIDFVQTDMFASNVTCVTRPGTSAQLFDYDVLFLLFSYSYYATVHTADVVDINEFFKSCDVTTVDAYTYDNLLPLIKPSRFDITTIDPISRIPLGLISAAEIYLALRNIFEHTGHPDAGKAAGDKILQVFQKPQLPINIAVIREFVLTNYAFENKAKTRSFYTIAYFAKVDNPIEYQKFLATKVWSTFYAYVMMVKSDIPIASACAAYLAMDYRVIPDKIKTNIELYKRDATRYSPIKLPKDHIRHLLSCNRKDGILFKLISAYHSRLNSVISTITNEASPIKQLLAAKIDVMNKLKVELTKSTYADGVANNIIVEIYNEHCAMGAEERMEFNNDRYLTGVANGIIQVCHLAGGKLGKAFRECRPDDMVSLSTRAKYDPTVKNREEWRIINAYYEERFPSDQDPGVKNWYLAKLAQSIFIGANHKTALHMVGPTDAGKTTEVENIHQMLCTGYYESLAANIMNDTKLTSEAPNPSLERAYNARLHVIEEIAGMILSENYKTITGGETTMALRGMYQSGKTMRNRSDGIYLSNHEPTFSNLDAAVYTRATIILMRTRYVSPDSIDLPATAELQKIHRIYPRNDDKIRLIRESKDAMMMLLLDHLGNYCDENGRPTSLTNLPKIMQEWKKGLSASDPVLYFKQNHMVPASNPGFAVPFTNIYRLFSSVNTTYRISEIDLIARLSGIIGSHAFRGTYIVGWTVIGFESQILEMMGLNVPGVERISEQENVYAIENTTGSNVEHEDDTVSTYSECCENFA